MILAGLLLQLFAHDVSLADAFELRMQEETGVPLVPYVAFEGGVTIGQFPEEWGLKDDRDSGWYGSMVLGGAHLDSAYNVQLRLTYRQWDELEIEEANGASVAGTDAQARVQGAVAEFAADYGWSGLKIGGSVGGGLYLLKHRYERDVAPSWEGGLYLRLQPVSFFYLQGGADATWVRNQFNRESYHTDALFAGYVGAALEIKF